MAEASANSPEIQRLSAVEREILRCVAIGEVADFTGKKWSRSRKVDGRPVVAAKFLADLWLGMHSVRVHPFGINIKGLHVGGAVELGGARVDARMRTPLIGFVAIDCRFTGRFGIDNAKVETVAFYDCVFDSPQQGRACVSAGSAEIIGQFGMSGCKLGGTLVLRNAVIDDDLGIYDTTVEAGIWAEGAEIRGNATFRTARIANSANAISLYDAIVAGKVEISHCVLEGGLVVIQLSAGAVTLSHTSLSGPFGRLAANFASVAHSLHITHCRLEKGATLAGCKIGGQIFINRSRIGSAAPDPWALTVSSATVAISVMIQSCRINGGIRAYDLDSGEHLRLQHISCRLPGSNLIGLDLTRCTVASLDFQNCFIGGQTKLDHAKLGRADIYDCTIDMRGRRGRMVLGDDVVVRFPGLTLYGAVIDRDLVINGSSAQSGCAIDGGLSVVSMHCGGHMVVRQCWLGKEGLENSLNAWDLKAALIEIDRCMLPSGLDASDLQTADMRLKSSVCCAPTSGPSEYIAANLMGARIGRSCTIGNDPGEGKSLLQLIGSLVLADGEVGNTLWLQGLVQSQPALHAVESWAGGFSATGARLGDVYFGEETANGRVAAFEGCLALDRATIKSLRLYASLSASARQKGTARSFADSDGDDCSRGKWGVALSLLGATVERGLSIHGAKLSGMADLKNFTAAAMLDKGGRNWAEAGLEPGQIRLDGLSFADLDDDTDAGAEAGGTTAHPAGVVQRRLDWLAMQYPGGEPDAGCFTPQPYEQLASHYASLGDERARRQVLVRKRQLQRRHSGLGWIERQVSGLLGLTSHYGYSPGRASLSSAVLVALGTLAAWWLHHIGAIVPSGDGAERIFSPLLYAIDMAVPFLDLGHDSAWRIDPAQIADFPGRTLALGLAEALYRLAGLVMLSITVLTFSGILHEKD